MQEETEKQQSQRLSQSKESHAKERVEETEEQRLQRLSERERPANKCITNIPESSTNSRKKLLCSTNKDETTPSYI